MKTISFNAQIVYQYFKGGVAGASSFVAEAYAQADKLKAQQEETEKIQTRRENAKKIADEAATKSLKKQQKILKDNEVEGAQEIQDRFHRVRSQKSVVRTKGLVVDGEREFLRGGGSS